MKSIKKNNTDVPADKLSYKPTKKEIEEIKKKLRQALNGGKDLSFREGCQANKIAQTNDGVKKLFKEYIKKHETNLKELFEVFRKVYNSRAFKLGEELFKDKDIPEYIKEEIGNLTLNAIYCIATYYLSSRRKYKHFQKVDALVSKGMRKKDAFLKVFGKYYTEENKKDDLESFKRAYYEWKKK